jgi:predicted Zn-ribbon and HTH transcriptional regulator
MMTCTCGYEASDDCVAIADECPSCKANPFPVSDDSERIEA